MTVPVQLKSLSDYTSRTSADPGTLSPEVSQMLAALLYRSHPFVHLEFQAWLDQIRENGSRISSSMEVPGDLLLLLRTGSYQQDHVSPNEEIVIKSERTRKADSDPSADPFADMMRAQAVARRGDTGAGDSSGDEGQVS